MHRLRRAHNELFARHRHISRARWKPRRGNTRGDPVVGKVIAFIQRRRIALAGAAARRGRSGSRFRSGMSMQAGAGPPDQGPLAIICGAGTLPFAVADAVRARGRDVVMFALRGWADPERVAAYRHHWGALGQFGWVCRQARAEGCRDIVFIGTIARPPLWRLRFDWGTLRSSAAASSAAYRGGDNHLLSGIAKAFEQQGFRLVGAHEVAPEILDASRSVSASASPTHRSAPTSRRRCACWKRSGSSTSVRRRSSRAITCWRSRGPKAPTRCWSGSPSCAQPSDRRHRRRAGEGAEARQDWRFDLPSIGPQTIEGAARAGLAGVAVLARASIVAEPQRVTALADAPASLSSASTPMGRWNDRVRPDRGRCAFSWWPERNPATGWAPPLMRALRERQRRRALSPASAAPKWRAKGLQPVSDQRSCHHGLQCGAAKTAADLPPHPRNVSAAVIAAQPDVLVIIDSPDFTHRVARRRARRRAVDSDRQLRLAFGLGLASRPRAQDARAMSIMCWRCCRSSRRRIARLGGPPCSYVGHPLAETASQLRPNDGEAARRLADPPVLLVLPGSRSGEIRRLLGVFARSGRSA